MTTNELLCAAAAWLDAHALYQGYYGFGLLKADEPKPGKPWPAPHAINICPPDGVHQLDACDIMGALLWAAGAADYDDPLVLDALVRLKQELERQSITWSVCAWSDAPNRTAYQVALLLRAAAKDV